MNLYRQPFWNEELCSDVTFFVTLILAKAYIANKESYNFVVVKSESLLLDAHSDCVYYSSRNNPKKVKRVEATAFCRRMANFARLVNNAFALSCSILP